MAARRHEDAGVTGRTWGVALVVLGLLLFTWPFMRTPPLGLLGSYVHLLGAWAVVIAAIAATTRKLGRGGDDG